LETTEQFETVKNVCKKHNITALVIIGGDDSNTNAAVLAEYFLNTDAGIAVVGCPKTIDGDLKNEFIEISFGFDTATKTYSELIGNLMRDANSAKKYWHFIKLMGRSASHIALECALQTQPNVCLVSEEIENKQMSLQDVVDAIVTPILKRAEKGLNYGIILIPEGVIEFIPEVKVLISSINTLLAKEADEYNAEGKFIRTVETAFPAFITYQRSFVMRELHGHSFLIRPTVEIDKKTYYLKDLQFSIIPEGKIAPPTHISKAFLPLYQSAVSNFATSYLRDLATTTPRMLILTQPPLATMMEDFMLWKKQVGIETDLFTTNDTGTSNTQIKEFIQTRYDNESTRPDYILILGDVDDTFSFPSFYYGAENNVSDQPYTFLSGNDYFPDVLAGRFSVDTSFELNTIIAKQFRYARNPYIEYGDWFENAVLVAGNYASSPPTPTTPKDITIWLGEKMDDYGFDNISEIYYPPTYPGTNQITAAINNGASFVTYRGWGDANGWHYPYYHTENIASLNNGAMLPIMTSIVCNTGDFANNVDPCFGEAMLRAGTPSSPKGMVAFVGPSDLHTSTKYNNNIFSGFYGGLQ